MSHHRIRKTASGSATTFMKPRAGIQLAIRIAALAGVDVRDFAQQFALDPAFRARVRSAMADSDDRPELRADIVQVKRTGSDRMPGRRARASKLTFKATVMNTSPNRARKRAKASLYLSEDNRFDPTDDILVKTVSLPKLKGHASKTITIKHRGSGLIGQYALLVIDTTDAVAEQVEGNLFWQRIQ